MRIRLTTNEGLTVAAGTIPDSPYPLPVLIWGDRAFVYHGEASDTRQYSEIVVFHLVEGLTFLPETTPPPCPRCNGCGQIDDGDDGAPWSDWEALQPGQDIAVRMGIVRPKPCPDCQGKGTR